jgi:uncharacterized protein (DUF1330 family)
MTAQPTGPILMIVLADIKDREKMAGYSKALAESGLYEEFGGYYAAIGKPLQVVEGDFGPGEAIVAAKFPSLDAARGFWFSPKYQDVIKPYRAGAGDFRVAFFPILPIPERIDWEPRS